ncbi:Hypothetical protein I595_3550 [Croceitalea dokdonensis DOKDO 023]|uniref:Uncharacterized protein n=1 Tax=Croceitalea dokdonensis DOKDO 023 TaxID=1300341 RepID=A0A0P7ARE4_9FLAO|nr:DUF1223 domain-containing protein [Croceitalea dokdonensis]KPM30389.1 Hypothetical protein I595_3550 [Croceitalea dokdonensis DOKDO 023]
MIKKTIGVSMVLATLLAIVAYSGPMPQKTLEPDVENTLAPIVVLELFTSQGCSSCPPADVLLEKVKSQFPKKVFALSYHVDYWNYIGWKDPFSKAAYTKKQQEYNRKFKSNTNYTPQLVVNGATHVVGSNTQKVQAAIGKFGQQNSENGVKIVSYAKDKGKVEVRYMILGALDNKLLRAVLVINERVTSVPRGENRNRSLKNTNIVIAESYQEATSGHGKLSIDIPVTVRPDDVLTLMLIVENKELGITGAAKTAI